LYGHGIAAGQLQQCYLNRFVESSDMPQPRVLAFPAFYDGRHALRTVAQGPFLGPGEEHTRDQHPVTNTLPVMGGCLSSALPIEARVEPAAALRCLVWHSAFPALALIVASLIPGRIGREAIAPASLGQSMISTISRLAGSTRTTSSLTTA
jgi:hypothetical protein